MIKTNKHKTFLLITAILFIFSIQCYAKDDLVTNSIHKQVISANDCEALAYKIELKNLDADEVFKDCVERRAIRIAMINKYGPEKYGKIDIFDKIEAYSYLLESKNKLVQNEANSYATAAGE